MINFLCPGAVAQPGERLPCKQEVVGSIPTLHLITVPGIEDPVLPISAGRARRFIHATTAPGSTMVTGDVKANFALTTHRHRWVNSRPPPKAAVPSLR